MTNRYELTITFNCSACRKENVVKSTVESENTNLQEVARQSDVLPRTCTACNTTGSVGLNDRIMVNPL